MEDGHEGLRSAPYQIGTTEFMEGLTKIKPGCAGLDRESEISDQEVFNLLSRIDQCS